MNYSDVRSSADTNGMKGFDVNSYPHIFTDVTKFAEWIESTVNEKSLNSIYWLNSKFGIFDFNDLLLQINSVCFANF